MAQLARNIDPPAYRLDFLSVRYFECNFGTGFAIKFRKAWPLDLSAAI